MCVAGVFFARLTTLGTLPVSMKVRDDADGFGGNRFLRLIGGRADVMRADDVRQRQDRIVERRLRRRRFVGEHVEADAQPLLATASRERGVVHAPRRARC